MIGVAIRSSRGARGVLDAIVRAEGAGIDAAWLSGGAGADSVTSIAAAAVQTRRVKLGTAVVQDLVRHPVALAQEARTIAQLAPGRFRLGVGPSHRALMEPLGLDFRAPLATLREYVTVLKALLHQGYVDFEGETYRVRYSLGETVDVPVMISALRPTSFTLAGEIADGAISWFCPPAYLRDVAIPAMERSAAAAGRGVPSLIAHALVYLDEDRSGLRDITCQPAMVAPLRLPYYQRMFREAGFPEAEAGEWSDAMIDATIIHGNDAQIAERLAEMLGFGNVELMITPVVGGQDFEASFTESVERLARIASLG